MLDELRELFGADIDGDSRFTVAQIMTQWSARSRTAKRSFRCSTRPNAKFLVESGQIKGAGVHAFADRTRSLLARAKGDRA
jgi:hypothetical protein